MNKEPERRVRMYVKCPCRREYTDDDLRHFASAFGNPRIDLITHDYYCNGEHLYAFVADMLARWYRRAFASPVARRRTRWSLRASPQRLQHFGESFAIQLELFQATTRFPLTYYDYIDAAVALAATGWPYLVARAVLDFAIDDCDYIRDFRRDSITIGVQRAHARVNSSA